MKSSLVLRLGVSAAALCWVAAAAHPTSAATVTALLARAEHNINTVRTLQHNDVINETAPGVSIHATIHGLEDEVRNREHDVETVTASGVLSNGKRKTIHYTLDVIFMNGHTYFRTTLNKNKWQKRSGMAIQDPISGIGFSRARTTVRFASDIKFGAFHGSKTHLIGHATRAGVASTYQVWLSNGRTPYVVRQLVTYHRLKGKGVSGMQRSSFGPFNKSIVILAPTTQGST